MDTTPEYIKKCEKSKEIQQVRALGQNNQGDWFKLNIPYPNIMIISEADIRKIPEGAIWLPTQDRLQEMVREEVEDKRAIGLEICNLYVWYMSRRGGDVGVEIQKWPTWEMLWLDCVMEKKFGKVWDSTKEEWVASSSGIKGNFVVGSTNPTIKKIRQYSDLALQDDLKEEK